MFTVQKFKVIDRDCTMQIQLRLKPHGLRLLLAQSIKPPGVLAEDCAFVLVRQSGAFVDFFDFMFNIFRADLVRKFAGEEKLLPAGAIA